MNLNFNNKMRFSDELKDKVKNRKLISSTDQESEPLFEIKITPGEGADSDHIGLEWVL